MKTAKFVKMRSAGPSKIMKDALDGMGSNIRKLLKKNSMSKSKKSFGVINKS